jgi:hypothetical protein
MLCRSKWSSMIAIPRPIPITSWVRLQRCKGNGSRPVSSSYKHWEYIRSMKILTTPVWY